ncbi:uncharacterized protein LOC119723747 [Patiria miniata]|uniref:PDZ domain-containing protein n=1 Tax=Patiria miniata TaxID=46514 RepID=A0A913ZFE2_PATMI|nr:uncharacterized protein LOC119723747 [Patiria miniata]
MNQEMAQEHLIGSGVDGSNHGDEGRVSPAPLSEAAAPMGAGLDLMEEAKHRVKDLIHRFEPSGHRERGAAQEGEALNKDIGVEETISSSTITEEESLPGNIITKTVHKVERRAKIVGHAVVEGVKQGARELQQGARELQHGVEILIEKFLLPESSLEQHPGNNVHVPHPDKLIGGMVGLGIHIQKDAKGHVVRTVIPDGLAAKSKLQENDVIVSVNGNDVTSWEFEELQQFFGSLEEVDFKIVIERQEEDESGNFVCRKVTISIKISLEGDQVMVDVDVKVRYSQWYWNGESEPSYIFQNNRGQSTKYLTLKNKCFCMSTANDLTPCRFKFFYYMPFDFGPRAIINLNNDSPLDHGEPSRIGVNSAELRESLFILNDDRIFLTVRQDNTNRLTFELASKRRYYLTADSKGNLTTTYFSDVEAVDESGQFNIVHTSEVDKMTPSDRQNYNPKVQGRFNGKGKGNSWK